MGKPRILVARFAPHALRLANQLNSQGVFALAQPLLEVQKSAEFANARSVFTKTYDYIIAVSSNAVDYTDLALSGNCWPVTCYLAVGKATQARLRSVTGQQVIRPPIVRDVPLRFARRLAGNVQIHLAPSTAERLLFAQTIVVRRMAVLAADLSGKHHEFLRAGITARLDIL